MGTGISLYIDLDRWMVKKKIKKKTQTNTEKQNFLLKAYFKIFSINGTEKLFVHMNKNELGLPMAHHIHIK